MQPQDLFPYILCGAVGIFVGITISNQSTNRYFHTIPKSQYECQARDVRTGECVEYSKKDYPNDNVEYKK